MRLSRSFEAVRFAVAVARATSSSLVSGSEMSLCTSTAPSSSRRSWAAPARGGPSWWYGQTAAQHQFAGLLPTATKGRRRLPDGAGRHRKYYQALSRGSGWRLAAPYAAAVRKPCSGSSMLHLAQRD